MSEVPPAIDSRSSGVIGNHAVSGYAAAMIGRLVPGNWREWLRHERVVGDDLREVEAALAGLEAAAATWRAARRRRFRTRKTAAPAEGQRKSDQAESKAWLTTPETGKLLGLWDLGGPHPR